MDRDMGLTFKVKELSNAVLKMQASSCKLAANFRVFMKTLSQWAVF